MEIRIEVVRQKLSIASSLRKVVEGSQEFVRFVFKMDKSWDGLKTFAQFIQDGVGYNVYLDDDNAVYLPPEIKNGTCALLLYGTKGKTIATTNYITLTVDKSMMISDASSTEITIPIYNQLVNKTDEQIAEIRDEMESTIGNLPDLKTTDVSNIVAAINELDERLDNVSGFIISDDGSVSALVGNFVSIPDKSVTMGKLANEVSDTINATKAAVGGPLVAATAAKMTDKTKVYVYTGSESGYTNGNWYYHDGSKWASGGVYNSQALVTDTTLTIAGAAADSKVTGDNIDNLKSALNPISEVSVDSILSEAKYPNLAFELGNIAFTSSGWNYSDNVKRVRTPEGKGFKVNIGDVISLTDYTDARFYMGILSDGVYHNFSWSTQDRRCDFAGTCVLLVSNITEQTQSNVNDLASLVRVYKYNTLPDMLNDVSNRVEQIGKDASNNFSTLTYGEIPLEYGDIVVSDNTITYPYSVIALRTPEDFSVHLYPGDKVYLSDYSQARFSLILTDSGGTTTIVPYRNTDFVVGTEGYYKIKLRLEPVANIYDPITLQRLLRIDRRISESSSSESSSYAYDIYPIHGVSHRGVQYQAPENTMPAFRLSVTNGFKFIETDVQFTSDNVPILIHDTTVDRTTDGTGAVNSFTLAQIEELDAGSWFNTSFAGTKIPTLEEFLIFCKRTNVYPYLELKSEATYTQEQVHIIVEMCRQYNMLNSVSWISWSNDWLNLVLNEDKTARIGRARNVDITGGGVISLNAFKTGYNHVFWLYNISANNITLTDAGIRLAKAANQDIEIAIVSTSEDMNTILSALTESGYISGCLSNGTVNFAEIVKQRELT